MITEKPRVGMCFDRSFPAAAIIDVARSLDQGGADELWVIEDCFFTAGPSLAAAALAVTERLSVGLGILPAVARTAPVTAMEIATLCGLGPGRVIAGIGHGVQPWMEQMGVRPASPLTALEEVLTTVQRLLAGERVSLDGRYVRVDDVQLDAPPATRPPVLAGVRGPKSLALAGRVCDGVVLADFSGPTYVESVRHHMGQQGEIATFTVLSIDDDPRMARLRVCQWLAGVVEHRPPEVAALPFVDEMAARMESHGADGLADLPDEYWAELGAVGTLDDAHRHIEALAARGVARVALFPPQQLDQTLAHLDHVLALSRP